MGLEQAIPPVSTPFLSGKTEVSEAIHKVASIWLKIAEQAAYG